MALTAEQQSAAEAAEPRVFVSAGAGTGKTLVLVSRYLELVLERGVPPESIAAITFTRKAAGELRARIRAGVIAAERPDLLQAIDRSPLGTIDSLCVRLLRSYGLFSGIHPSGRVLEESEARVLLDDALAQAVRDLVAGAAERELDLVARHGKEIEEAARSAFQALRAAGQAHPQIVVGTRLGLEAAKGRLRNALDGVERVVAHSCLSKPTAVQNYEKARLCSEWLDRCEPDLAAIIEVTRYVPAMSGQSNKELFGEFRDALIDLDAALGEAYAAEVGQVVARLVWLLDRAYSARKAELAAFDFADLEIEAVALLEDMAESGSLTSPLGLRHLLVDEFQDTNTLQCRLFSALQPESIMTVGDYFQSIYGFRNADCEVFRAQKESLWTREVAPPPGQGWAAPDSSSRYVPLTVSFRAATPLLEVLNTLFASPTFFGEDYQPLRAPERPEKDSDESALTGVEIVLVQPEVPGNGDAGDRPRPLAEDRARLEAREVARRVAELVKNGRAKRDIAVLLRRLTYAQAYASALEAEGLDTYVVGGRGYYLLEEVGDLLALLRVLADPTSDIDVVAVLRSPMVDVTDDALLHLGVLRKTQRLQSFWEAIQRRELGLLSIADDARLARFERAVQALARRRVETAGLSGLVDAAAQALDLDLMLLGSEAGLRRYANVRKLMRLADAFEELEGPDLLGFLDYLQRREELDDREGEAAILAEEEDVVRIMTVHQAKGLEFPLVVVAGLGDVLAPRLSSALVDEHGALALRLTVPRRSRVLGNSIAVGPYNELAERRRAKEAEEEKRICYVAATRAQKRLLLVGCAGSDGRVEPSSALAWFLSAAGLDPRELVAGSPHLHAGVDLACQRVLSPFGSGESTPELGVSASQDGVDALQPRAGSAERTQVAVPDFPQERVVVGGRVRTLSFSALSLYLTCPRKYFLERVLGLVGGDAAVAGGAMGGAAGYGEAQEEWDEMAAEEAGGVARGLVVHRVLERIDVAAAMPDAFDVLGLVAQAERDLALVLSGGERDACVEAVQALWRSPVRGLDLVGAERELPFAFTIDGVLIRGIMDLVVRRQGHWHVVDYKTNRLGGRTPAECAAPYELQASLYASAALRAGAQAVTCHVLFLEKPAEPVRFEYGPEDRRRIEERLLNLLEEIRSGRFPREPSRCPACAWTTLCVD